MKNSLILLILALTACQPTANPQQEAALNTLQKLVARKNDSIALLTARLAQAEAPTAASATPPAPPATAGPTPRLYGKPVITELTDADLPEVLSLFDSTTTTEADDYRVKAFRACTGPADPALDYCNCSHYIYLALDTYDIPYEYKAYRIGPFYEAEFAGWQGQKNQPELRIRHQVKGRATTNTFRISFAGVRQL